MIGAPRGQTDRRAAAAAAAIRLTLANRRAAWAANGARLRGRDSGRGAGRRACAMPALGAIDAADPALVLIVDPARGERILAAAAAALAAGTLLRAIAAPDRADADAIVTAESRAFAVRHRHLSLPSGDLPLAQALGFARRQAAAAWRARLPAMLAAECPDYVDGGLGEGAVEDAGANGGGASPAAGGTSGGQPLAPRPGRHRGGPLATLRNALGAVPGRGTVALPAVAGAVPVADRPAAALALALAEISAAHPTAEAGPA